MKKEIEMKMEMKIISIFIAYCQAAIRTHLYYRMDYSKYI